MQFHNELTHYVTILGGQIGHVKFFWIHQSKKESFIWKHVPLVT